MQLLEREAQLRSLELALGDARTRAGCIALIHGEAGIGKTSLVETFLQGNADSWRILRGACDSLFTPRPLGPLHDIALQTGGALLQRLEAGSDRNTIFAAFLSELGSQPTIAIVEDLHWADETTLDLLKYVGRRIRQTGALLILTHRDDEIGVGHQLRRLLGDLGSSDAVQRIQVSALSQAAVQQLARDRSVDAAELHRLTSGNPFFVTEVLATEGGIPETVRDAVLARAARLSPSARAALEAAAVIGVRVEPWLLSRLAQAESEQLEECMAAGMLHVQGDFYAFRHELARQTILEATTPHRKVALHRLALTALQESPETRRDLARLANHAEGTQDASLALEFAPVAARQASAASAHREAVALYELALRFHDRLTVAEHARMLDEYVVELTFTGRFNTSLAPAREAVALWEAAGEPLRQGDSLANLAIILYPLGHKEEAEQAAQSAITILEALPENPELARAYKALCFIRMESRDTAEAVSWGNKAMAMAERCGDMDTLARACNYTGCAAMLMDYGLGRQLMERSLEIGQRANMPFAVGGTLTNLSQMLVELYRLSEAHPLLEQGIEYATDHDDDYHLNSLLTLQALALFRQGEWDRAGAALLAVLERPGADFAIRANAAFALARLRIRRGDPGASAGLAETIALYSQMDLIVPLGALHAGPAEQAWLAGDLPRAIQEARAVYDSAVGKQLAWIAGELAFWRWRAGDRFTPPAWIAEPYASQIAGDWRRSADLWAACGCPYEQGMALMDGDEAAQLEALRIFEHLGAKPIAERLKQQMRAQGVRGIPRGPRPSTRENAFGLTARELEVLSALVSGSANSAIAKQLNLSIRTVEHHLAAIFQKTGTQSRSEAVALALREKLVDGA